MQRLQVGRRWVGWLVLASFTLVFLLSAVLPPTWSAWLARTQLVPSLLGLIGGAMVTGAAVIVIVLATWLFGRVYCASFCPLGVLQDVVSAISRKVRKRRRPWCYLPPRQALRYGVLAVVAVTAMLGLMSLLNLLDPYSLFGRLVTDLLRPLYVVLHNGVVSLLESLDIYVLTRRRQLAVPLGVLSIVGTLAIVLVVMAARYGRLWCNTLCPVGALLGLVARHSRWRIQVANESCNSCGACAKSCRASCLESDQKAVDLSRCVACFDCLDACPSGAISYAPVRADATAEPAADPHRRHLLLGAAALIGAAVPLRLLAVDRLVRPMTALPICPPGADSPERFSRLCTGCQLCVTSCPERVIRPTFLAHGPQALMQPVLDYTVGYCSYECNLCGDICPTGALQPLDLPVKKRLQIGRAVLDKDACVVYADKKECGACIEVCPTHAVYSDERDGMLYPEMDKAPCIGCGHCQLVCPKKEPPAIYVEANELQVEAAPPNYDRIAPELLLEPDEQTGEDGFPF